MRLIDADRLRADVIGWENCYNGFSDTYDKARIIDAIDEQPTIKAEPVHYGRWIPKGYPWDTCSCCGTYVNGYDCWKYCPNCGTKMEKNNE